MNKVILFALSLLFYGSLQAQFSFNNGTDLLPGSGLVGTHPIAVSDINGDGYDDIVVLDEFIIFFQNPEDGSFDKLELNYDNGDNAWGMCVGDMNNDGYSDMLYGGYFDGLSVVMHSPFIDLYFRTNHEDDDFMVFLQGVNFADIDNDGNLDIFACHDVGPSKIYLGDGLGGFTLNSTIIDTELNGGGENDSGNYGSLFTDINNDGLIDLYIAKCRQGVSSPTDPRRINLLFINNGDGTYTEEAADWGINSGEQSWSADFGDIDNDGDMDLLLGQHTNEFVQIYENDGEGNFTDITSDAGMSGSFSYHVIQSKFADFDNDGYLDIIIAGSSHFMFAHNNGDNTFDLNENTNIYSTMNSFAIGDLNHDGYTDVYSTPAGYGSWGSTGTDSLYLNDGGENHFLTFDLEGSISNRDGIGARVTLYSSLGTQIRDIRSGESYGIQNSLTAHFGMGSLTMADSVTVLWPSGIIDKYVNLESDQFIHVVEGSNAVGIEEAIAFISFSVYPNPSDEKISITIEEDPSLSDLSIKILDTQGKLIYSQAYISGEKINVQSFTPGVYFLNIHSNGKLVGSKKISIR